MLLPKKLGQVEQLIPDFGIRLLEQLVPPDQIMAHRGQFDADVLLSVLSFAAKNAMGVFQSELMRIFPDASVIGMHELDSVSDRFALLIAPVKAGPRVRAKLQEYVAEYGHNPSNWPFVRFFGDLLR